MVVADKEMRVVGTTAEGAGLPATVFTPLDHADAPAAPVPVPPNPGHVAETVVIAPPA